MARMTLPPSEIPDEAVDLPNHPSGALLAVAVLLGRCDGKVFVSDQLFRAVEPMRIRTWRDESRAGWWLAIDAGGT